MGKIRFLPVLVLLAMLFTVAAGATDNSISNQISVVSYQNEKDYMEEILKAVEDGSDYALEIASIYEMQRNLKIEAEGLDVKKTDFFSNGMRSDEIEAAIQVYLSPSPYVLTASERTLLERAVMAEAGGESYQGQMMVAQCILDGALRNGFDVATSIRRYQIVTTNRTVSDSVKNAVSAVFDSGERVTEQKADLWYAPYLCSSSWHENQVYVTTIGVHKFFWMRNSMS